MNLAKDLSRELEKRYLLVFEQGEVKIGKQLLSQYRFSHTLIQQYLYDELGASERRIFHGEIAEILEAFSAALVAAGLSRDAVEVERDLEALTRKDHTLVPSGVSEWPDGTYSGSYAFRHILYQNVVLSASCAGTARANAQASGQEAGTGIWRSHLGNRTGTRASFRTGPGLSERLALPGTGGREFREAPWPRGSGQLSNAWS